MQRPKCSKYVYGQFIEHLGRCIYGGMNVIEQGDDVIGNDGVGGGAAGGQGAARPPDVERADVPVADRLFPAGVSRYPLDG